MLVNGLFFGSLICNSLNQKFPPTPDPARNCMSKTFATADLCDAHEAHLRSCPLQFRDFGALRRFSGIIRTVKCYDDNVLVRRTLETPGEGKALVVDGAGYLG